MDIGIIGFGAIGRTMFRLLAEHEPSVRVALVFEQAALHPQVRALDCAGRAAPGKARRQNPWSISTA